jgi:non-ribosomal peptide synthetase component E (peptide arylation enzyme)
MTVHSPFLNAILKHAENTPSKAAIIINDKIIPFIQLKNKIFQAVSFLLQLDLKKGDSIILSAQ